MKRFFTSLLVGMTLLALPALSMAGNFAGNCTKATVLISTIDNGAVSNQSHGMMNSTGLNNVQVTTVDPITDPGNVILQGMITFQGTDTTKPGIILIDSGNIIAKGNKGAGNAYVYLEEYDGDLSGDGFGNFTGSGTVYYIRAGGDIIGVSDSTGTKLTLKLVLKAAESGSFTVTDGTSNNDTVHDFMVKNISIPALKLMSPQ